MHGLLLMRRSGLCRPFEDKQNRRTSRVAAAAGKMLTTGVTLNRLNTLLSELRIASRNGSLVVDTCRVRVHGVQLVFGHNAHATSWLL